MAVQTIIQSTLVDTVGSVVLSAITQDPATNLFIRTIQVYALPDINGNVNLQFTLTVSGATQSAVEMSSPVPIILTAPSAQI